MAGASLLTLIDDIASVLDDISVMTKVAAKKTAGVLGDDLALNAQQVSGVNADRELPVVWAVAKGSIKNKCILVPAALAISVFANWAITPLLMLGGLFLCYEGFEKLAHTFFHHSAPPESKKNAGAKSSTDDVLVIEQEKIKGAVRTDFILSAEIITITLGTVATASLYDQVAVMVAVAIIMTVGVYGLVAGIVKLDDAGLYLLQLPGESRVRKLQHILGRGILGFAPRMMKSLSVIGTAAMFMVGGGILAHGLHAIDALIERGVNAVIAMLAGVQWLAAVVTAILPAVLHGLLGVLAGALALLCVMLVSKLISKLRS
jgi:predicted DNA repair protein MutK